MMFEDRQDAGLKLCPRLKKYSDKKDVLVFGLTRGGIITAKIISSVLHLKLKAIVVKKIGAPTDAELAIGALASPKDVFWNEKYVREFKISETEKQELISNKSQEIRDFKRELGINDAFIKNKTVILVDDGVATGASVIAAWKYLKRKKAKKVILATPVIAADILRNINKYFDNIIYLKKKSDFYAVGQFYHDFRQIPNEEVAEILVHS